MSLTHLVLDVLRERRVAVVLHRFGAHEELSADLEQTAEARRSWSRLHAGSMPPQGALRTLLMGYC